MESVKRAKNRFLQYPKYFKECGVVAADYARCVALKENVLKDDCVVEFRKFKKCMVEAAKKSNSRL